MTELSPSVASWITLHEFNETTSTQHLAKEAAESGADEGALFLAQVQTRGRGRLDRSWSSGKGGLWFSLILRPSSSVNLSGFSLLVSLALSETLSSFDVESVVKWPNDVLLSTQNGFRKVAGILIESSVDSSGTRWVVVGVGVNVRNQLEPELNAVATTLTESAAVPPDSGQILNRFLQLFRERYDRFMVDGFKPFVEPYWESAYKPEQVCFQTAEQLLRGEPVGVSVLGELVLDSNGKRTTLSEGEILPVYNESHS